MNECEVEASDCILEGKSIPAEIVGKVKWLDLSHSRVTDKMLLALEPLTELRVLWLDGTKITDAGLEYLPAGIRELNLAGTPITDAGLLALERLTKLQVLNIKYTKVTFEGVMRLQEALPRCNIHIAAISRLYHEGN